MTAPYVENLKDAIKENEFFRKVVFTGAHLQLVLMTLDLGEEIGEEVHEVDQLLFGMKGRGTIVLDGEAQKFGKGMVACVPAGTRHNVVNREDRPLKLFTIYAPPQHKGGTVDEKKPKVELALGSAPARGGSGDR